MTAKTKKTLMWVGGAGLAALAGFGIYTAMHPAAPAVPTALPAAGTPATSFASGQVYTFAAVVPAGVTDAQSLANALKTAGWSGVSILYFGPTNAGLVPAGLEASTSGYVATATWGGAANAPLPTNVIAVAGALPGTSVATA